MITAYQSYTSVTSFQSYRQQGGSVLVETGTQVRHSEVRQAASATTAQTAAPAVQVETQSANYSADRFTRTSIDSTVTYQPPQPQTPEPVAASEKVAAPAGDSELTDAASAILSAITAQVYQDMREGATEDQIASRIQAGLDGFLEGFNEAFDILSAQGSLNETVSDAIFQTFDQVIDGLNDLSQRKLNRDLDGLDQIERPQLPEADPEQTATSSPSLNSVPSSGQYAVSAGSIQTRDFSLTVTTADGDIVTLNSSSARAATFEYYASGADDLDTLLATQEAIATQYQSQDLEFNVQGELDVDELRALTELFAQINEAATLFYEGDVQAAYEYVMDIGVSGDELASYSLSLQSSTTVQVQEAYSSEQSGSRSDQGMQGLGEIMRHIQEAMGVAELFSNGNELLQDISRLFDRPDQQPVSAIIETLMPTQQSEDA